MFPDYSSSLLLYEENDPMKDFHRRKMALRIAIAKELHRRGVPIDEIAKTCRPSAQDIADFRHECDNTIPEADWIDVTPKREPVSRVTHLKPPRRKRRSGLYLIAVLLTFTTTLAWITIFAFML